MDDFPERVSDEKKQAVDDLLDRLASRGYAPAGMQGDYLKILDWLFVIGFTWDHDGRFIYRFLGVHQPPNPLGKDDLSNVWSVGS